MKTNAPALSSDRFDWAMGALSALLMAGIIQDGWAHNHGKVDDSFITPWHFILYGTMALNGIVLLVLGLRNVSQRRRAGVPFAEAMRDSLPYGYWASAIGVVIFIVGGGLDFAWHTLFGVEASIDALVSPTHLVLALAAAMVFSGPIRSVAYRYGPQSTGWSKVGPVVPALAAAITLVGFFSQYAQPIGDDGIASVIAKSDDAAVVGGLSVMRADGGAQQRLIPSTHDDQFGPSVSPDGRSVVYRVSKDGAPASDLYIARVDGTGIARRITHTGRHDTQPAWSPNGSWIAFVSAPAGTSGEYQLNAIHPDGSGMRTIVHGATVLSGPAWSPDGTQIAVGSRNGVDDEIETVDVASGKTKWLRTAQGGWPAWSADGTKIYFSKNDAQGNRASIDVASADGADPEAVLVSSATMPALSIDGRRIAYIQSDGGTDQVFVAEANGSNATDVSRLSGTDASRPQWAGNDRIVFVASGRQRPSASEYALALSLSGVLIQAIIVAGTLLMLVRRWRPPIGALTLILVLFAVALATQNDDYFAVPAAFITGIAADTFLVVLGDRARSGLPLYVLGFGLPFALTALYIVFLNAERGLGWPPNMIFGSPFIAGFAGLLVAFAYDPPLRRLPAGAKAD